VWDVIKNSAGLLCKDVPFVAAASLHFAVLAGSKLVNNAIVDARNATYNVAETVVAADRAAHYTKNDVIAIA
jgi:hypothetical protein